MNKCLIIIFSVILFAFLCFMPVNSTALEVGNFTVEKHIETINYVSGNVETNHIMTFNFTLIKNNGIHTDIKGNFILYDENENIIHNVSFENGGLEMEYSYFIDFLGNNTDKVHKVELIICDYNYGRILYDNNTTIIQKNPDIVKEIDDTPTQSSHHSTGRKYPTESMYNPPEKKDYVVVSKPGEPELRHYFNDYVPKFGQ